MILNKKQRSAATVVECALILPVFMLLLIGVIVMGLGVFRYLEVAHVAREGARYASVRGYQYQQTTGNPSATPKEIYDNAIKPNVVALDLSKLTYSVSWDPDDKRQGGMVTVTVNYQWTPEALFGALQFSSTSSVPISY